MTHLATCHVFRTCFWDPILEVMKRMNLRTPGDHSDTTLFLLLGLYDHAGKWKAVPQESAGILFIAWRCLYAEITQVSKEGKKMNLPRVELRVWKMVHSRLTAFGEKLDRLMGSSHK